VTRFIGSGLLVATAVQKDISLSSFGGEGRGEEAAILQSGLDIGI
jgi:hypothetical protein